jgi:hypothetical protein
VANHESGSSFLPQYGPGARIQENLRRRKSGVKRVVWAKLKSFLLFREGESSREITTLKMEIQQIMKGEVIDKI